MRTTRCYAFRDINPQAPTHVLVLPKEHMANVVECDGETDGRLGWLFQAAAAASPGTRAWTRTGSAW